MNSQEVVTKCADTPNKNNGSLSNSVGEGH